MGDSPAYVAFWMGRFVEATTAWTAEEVGAYVRLLLHQATHGHIPADVGRLARVAGMDRSAFDGIWRAVLSWKFDADPDDPGRLRNQRMADERARALRFSEEQRRKGRLGGRPEKAGAEPAAKAPAKPADKATQTQTQTQTENQIPEGAIAPAPAAAGSGGKAKRRDGKAELRAGIEDWEGQMASKASTDLREAAEAYRARRSKRRHPVWDRGQWSSMLSEGRGDQGALVAALRKAEQSGWQSVHPSPGRTGGRRDTLLELDAEVQARLGPR